VATGRGKSLGAALVNLYDQVAGNRRTSYTAKGWHAQVRALTNTAAGRVAADAAGLSPSARTLMGWLSQSQTPNAANRSAIGAAYRSLQGGFDRKAVEKPIEIKGRVTFSARDSRVRGENGINPLRVDGAGGDWSEVEKLWNAAVRDHGQHLDAFVDGVVEPDIGEVSEGSWSEAFDGDWYEVSV
jgi:hypothetical protein